MKKQKFFGKILIAVAVTLSLVLGSFYTIPAQAEAETVVCPPDDQSELMVAEGLMVTWDSSFECEDVADAGNYQISVQVALTADEEIVDHQIVIDSLVLSEEEVVSEDVETSSEIVVEGLPLTLKIGESGMIDISGMYELVADEEQEEQSELHLSFIASGMVEEVMEEEMETQQEEENLFELEINLVLKGEEPEDEDDEEDGDDPSSGFYCIQSEVQHPFGARLAERYGVEYTTLQEWFCDGFGWGQIMLALQTGMITGDEPGVFLEERSDGIGWGEIWQNLGLIGKDKSGDDLEESQSETKNGKPDFDKKSDKKDKEKDKGGKPDFAGRPEGKGKP